MASSPVPPGTDLCALPAAAPPNGQLPNFVNPPSLTTTTILIGVLMAIWAFVFAAARITINRRRLSCSDYFVVIGMIFNIAFTGVSISISKYNRHTWDVPACWMTPKVMKLQFVINLLVGPASYFSKSSILLLYRQVFSVKRSMGIAVYIGLFATFLIYFPTIPLSIRYTTPHDGQTWTDLFTTGELKRLVYYGVTVGTLAVVLDIYIFILQVPTLKALQMSLRIRLQLMAVFSTALMGVIASVVALVYRVKLFSMSDPTWQQATFTVAIMVENNIAIIVGCMSAVAAFVRVYISKLTMIKVLRLKLRRAHGDYSGGGSRPSTRRQGLVTFSSPNVRRSGSYELPGAAVMTAQTIADKDHLFLSSSRIIEDHKHYAQPNSPQRLV